MSRRLSGCNRRYRAGSTGEPKSLSAPRGGIRAMSPIIRPRLLGHVHGHGAPRFLSDWHRHLTACWFRIQYFRFCSFILL